MCRDDEDDLSGACDAPGDTGVGRRGLLTGTLAGLTGLAVGLLPASDALAQVRPDPRLLTRTPGIIPRRYWAGASCPVRGPLQVERPGNVRVLLVHHTQSPGNGYSAGAVPGLLRGMYGYHTGPAKRWPDLAYNLLVDRWGRIWEGRAGSAARAVMPSATGGSAGFSQLVCFLGDHSVVPPTPQAQASAISALALLARRHGVDPRPGAVASFISRGSNLHPRGTRVRSRTIEGHRAMSRTACPGAAAYPVVRHIFPTEVTRLVR